MVQERDPLREGVSIAARIGLEMAIATVLGAGLGYLIDSWLGSTPWGMIGGLLLGAAAGLRNVYRVTNPPDRNKPG
jgi:ATP synthase protein I